MLGGEATLRRSHPAGFTVGSGAALPRDNSFAQNAAVTAEWPELGH
jgi:hypothetical protein